MQIIPAINETSFLEIEKKIKSAVGFGAEWVHLDVSDGKFTENQLWNNPDDLKRENENPEIKIEAHLMVKNPEEVAGDWIAAGIKRLIMHAEAVKNLKAIKDICVNSGIELFIAGNPDSSVEEFLKYKDASDGFLVLAVKPGMAGQKFGENQLEKIRLLRAQAPDAKIIVDGGVDQENALRIKDAGADMLVAASAIWGSENPADSYKNLRSI